MVNKSHRMPVGICLRKLGACSVSEIAAYTGIEKPAVRACLHGMAAEGLLVEGIATYWARQGKSRNFLYWRWSREHGGPEKAGYTKIRQQYFERDSEAFEHEGVRGYKPRVLIVDQVQRYLEKYYPEEYSAHDITDALGVTYGKVTQGLRKLEEGGLVVNRKEIYGRGRPRLMWHAVNGQEPEDRKVYSFEDDNEAEELEY